MRKMTRKEIRKSENYVKLLVIYNRGGSRHIEIKFKGNFNDPTVRDLFENSETKINYSAKKPWYSKYVHIKYDIPSIHINKYIHGLNKVSGMKCTQVEHITSTL